MKKVLMALALVAIAAMGRAASPTPAQATIDPGGVWDEVCCGDLCQGGTDYCIGDGENTCCKG